MTYPAQKWRTESSHYVTLAVIVLYIRVEFDFAHSFISFIQMKKVTQKPQVEPEKLIAERINGWAAMMGFWAAIGAYLTTGQIIPGIV